jgi:hypothetical protein
MLMVHQYHGTDRAVRLASQPIPLFSELASYTGYRTVVPGYPDVLNALGEYFETERPAVMPCSDCILMLTKAKLAPI